MLNLFIRISKESSVTLESFGFGDEKCFLLEPLIFLHQKFKSIFFIFIYLLQIVLLEFRL